jgi:bifunctional non-homologous end joining protein LigD
LSLVRCPQGREHCFYQKHPGHALAADIPRITIEEKQGPAEYLHVARISDLIALVQAGTLEFHVWGSRVDDLERPDTLVFDLDPGDGVDWRRVLATARSLRDRLDGLGFAGFVRTTGGKGLHVVTPIEPSLGWEEVLAFTRAVAEAQVRDDPDGLTTDMAKHRRRGRIFIDYLRNARGATAVASYSTRARPGAPVAVPRRWDELGAAMVSDRYGVANLRLRLAALGGDPWGAFEQSRRPLTRRMLARLAR